MVDESRAFPTWTAAQIHASLNEPRLGPRTLADLTRVGRRLGENEGTTPDDDPQLGRHRRQARAEGIAQGRAEGIADRERAAPRPAGGAEVRSRDRGTGGRTPRAHRRPPPPHRSLRPHHRLRRQHRAALPPVGLAWGAGRPKPRSDAGRAIRTPSHVWTAPKNRVRPRPDAAGLQPSGRGDGAAGIESAGHADRTENTTSRAPRTGVFQVNVGRFQRCLLRRIFRNNGDYADGQTDSVPPEPRTSLLSFTAAADVRSYWDEVNLSLLGTRLSEADVVRELNSLAGTPAPVSVLPVAGIFGANASGKSTILRAMADMRAIVLGSFRRGDRESRLPRHSFLLHSEAPERPSRFAVDLVLNGVRWQYGFDIDDHRVLDEYAYHYPKGRQALAFRRNRDGGEPSFGPAFRSFGRALTRLVRKNALLLSVAGALEGGSRAKSVRERANLLGPLFTWFRTNLLLMESGNGLERVAALHGRSPASTTPSSGQQSSTSCRRPTWASPTSSELNRTREHRRTGRAGANASSADGRGGVRRRERGSSSDANVVQ